MAQTFSTYCVNFKQNFIRNILYLQQDIIDINLTIKTLLSEYGSNLQLTNFEKDYFEKDYFKKAIYSFKKTNKQNLIKIINDIKPNSRILKKDKSTIIKIIEQSDVNDNDNKYLNKYKLCDLLNIKIYGGDEENNEIVSQINNVIINDCNERLNSAMQKYNIFKQNMQNASEINLDNELFNAGWLNYSIKESAKDENINNLQSLEVLIDENLLLSQQKLQNLQINTSKLEQFLKK